MVREQSGKHRGLVAAVKSCLSVPSTTTTTNPKIAKTKLTVTTTDTQTTTETAPENHTDDHDQTMLVPAALPADVSLTLAMFTKAIMGIGHELIKLSHEWDAGLYERAYSYADYPAAPSAEWPLLPRHVVSLPKSEAFSSSKIGRVVERAHVFVRAQMPLVARLGRPPSEIFKDVGHDAFRAFFNSELFPMPRTILTEEQNYWSNDDCFTDQFVNGCNPTVIKRIKPEDVPSVPKELQAEKDPTGRSLTELAEAGHLYVADYEILATPGIAGDFDAKSGSFTNHINFDAVSNAPHMTKYFYAPYVAFYQRDDGHLGVLGIILTRHKDRRNDVYNLRTCEDKPNIYTFAKMHVACADNQTHQFYFHLGRCHLVFEPFGVAVRNVFQLGTETAKNHVVGRLLAPHFHDHIAINWLARNTLVAHGQDAIPFTDASFALGSGGGLRLLAAKYATWNLQDQAFPEQLRKRGFDPDGHDGLCYYYRDDGMRIWRALERYVETALKGFYISDSSDESEAAKERDALISTDDVLNQWCTEMRSRDRAAVRSFPEAFKSLDRLRDTVTTIMYNVSAEHAAVNASQERYLAYVPNRPNALFKPVPSPSEQDMHLAGQVLRIHRARGDDDDIGASMPLSFALFQVQFSQLLTLPPTKTLMEIEGVGISFSAVERLRKDLTRAHYEIHARNIQIEEDTPYLAPYEFLDPALVAQSIEI